MTATFHEFVLARSYIMPGFTPISHNLKLSQKGLLLVGIPLLFELIFITTLFLMLSEADVEIAQEVKSKSFIADVQRLNTLFKETAMSASMYATTRNVAMGKRISVLPAQMKADLQQLKAAAPDNQEERALLNKVDGLLGHLEEYLGQVKDMFDKGGRELAFMRVTDLLQEAGFIGEQTNDAFDQIVAIERESLKGRHAAANARKNVAIVLVGGMVLSVLVAVWMSRYIMQATTVRLETVMGNMNKLAKRQPLEPPISGTDEIAEVDKFFHNMADELQEVDRLKRELFAMASHDLRTPLTSLLMFFESFKEGVYGQPSHSATERIGSLERSVQRMVRLISDLLDLEKLEQGKLEVNLKPAEMERIVHESVASVRDLAEHRLIDLEVSDCQVSVMADDERLAQVLVNLLSNAIKFSPQGSTIYVTIEDVAGTQPQMVRVSVRDEGPGIPEDKQELVFERFKQMDNIGMAKRSGTGLGLPICKEIVLLHQGDIGVTSEKGQGSTFWFTLLRSDPSLSSAT